MLDFLFAPKEETLFRMVPVNLGSQSVEIPVAVIQGNRPGKTLLVTGGSDGDEYAGMEAAYGVAARFAGGDFAGKLVVIPVLNVPGFRAECSQSPLDQKFPKMLFPGRVDGTPTERMMHWLASAHAFHASAWIDLHGGAITEGLNPFLWLYETGTPETDLLAQAFFRSADAETVVFEKVGRMSRAGALAAKGCLYAIAESGDRGYRDSADVGRHLGWVLSLMASMGMTAPETETPRDGSQRVLRRAAFSYAPFDGIWYPSGREESEVGKGEALGVCVSLDGTGAKEISVPASGTLLWWKETMSMRRGDILAAIGTD